MKLLERLAIVGVVIAATLAAASWGQQANPTAPVDEPSEFISSPSGAQPSPTVQNPLQTKRGWLYNPRERTDRAIDALEQERPEEAITAATEARALAPGNPVAAFNQGTTHLLTGDATAAESALRPVAEATSDPTLSSDAAYNLGNAYFESKQHDQAVQWFEESLRRDPSRVSAKINLELALQAQQQEQQQQDQDSEDSEQNAEQDQQQEQQQGDEGETSPDPQEGEQEESIQPQPQQGQEESPLPKFQPQPDMTAEEAASLLEAVEAMEQEARAAEQPERRQAAPGNRDW